MARDGSTATIERAQAGAEEEIDAAARRKNGTGGPKGTLKEEEEEGDDEGEHEEVELATPFGKLELELEPTSRKERRDRKRREKEQRDAAKAAAEAALRAEKKQKKRGKSAERAAGGGKLLPILLVFTLIIATIAVLVWLFGSPEEPEDAVPEDYRTRGDDVYAAPASPLDRARSRIRRAIRLGRRASYEAQQDQQRRYEELKKGTSTTPTAS